MLEDKKEIKSCAGSTVTLSDDTKIYVNPCLLTSKKLETIREQLHEIVDGFIDGTISYNEDLSSKKVMRE